MLYSIAQTKAPKGIWGVTGFPGRSADVESHLADQHFLENSERGRKVFLEKVIADEEFYAVIGPRSPRLTICSFPLEIQRKQDGSGA